MDIGTKIKNEAANYLDDALKDIAQKFEALGKDAQDYFEGRARLISVTVAVVFAFVVHADAVDLYTTFLQNPNTTAAVIAKSDAITRQYEAAQKAATAAQHAAVAAKAADDAKKAADTKKQSEDAQKAVTQDDGKKPLDDAQKVAEAAKAADEAKKAADAKKQSEDAQKVGTQDDGKKQYEDALKAAEAAKAGAEKTVKQFADLGVPLGWTAERYEAADLLVLLWSCKKLADEKWHPWLTVWRTCKPDDKKPDDKNTGTAATEGNTKPAPAKDGNKGTPAIVTAAKDGTTADDRLKALNLKYTNVWFGIPMNLGVLFYLILGGLLIGLGAPFWYNVVTTITNIRGSAGGTTSSTAQAPSILPLRAAAPAEADKAQPATPAGAFQVAQAAKK